MNARSSRWGEGASNREGHCGAVQRRAGFRVAGHGEDGAARVMDLYGSAPEFEAEERDDDGIARFGVVDYPLGEIIGSATVLHRIRQIDINPGKVIRAHWSHD